MIAFTAEEWDQLMADPDRRAALFRVRKQKRVEPREVARPSPFPYVRGRIPPEPDYDAGEIWLNEGRA